MATFLLEHLLSDFWLPLEDAVIAGLPKLANWQKELVKQSGWDVEVICDFLKKPMAGVVASYTLSVFFLLCVLHATRIIDFRLLK